MGQRCGYSVTYFSKLFHQQTGEKFSDYVLKKRLELSLLYLQTGNDSIDEIAARCGFSSQSRYIEFFRRQYNKTPGSVRKEGIKGKLQPGQND